MSRGVSWAVYTDIFGVSIISGEGEHDSVGAALMI